MRDHRSVRSVSIAGSLVCGDHAQEVGSGGEGLCLRRDCLPHSSVHSDVALEIESCACVKMLRTRTANHSRGPRVPSPEKSKVFFVFFIPYHWHASVTTGTAQSAPRICSLCKRWSRRSATPRYGMITYIKEYKRIDDMTMLLGFYHPALHHRA